MSSIVLAGVGGQGIITVGKIIGEAAIMEGKKVLMTEVHGMAQRGGAISVDIRVGDYDSAIIPQNSADAIMGFELMEAARNSYKLRSDGFILANRRMIHPMPLIRTISEYPIEQAEEVISKFKHMYINADEIALSLGEKRSMNIVMLGAIYATDMLDLKEESIIQSIRNTFNNPRLQEINLRAFMEGARVLRKENIL